MSRAKRPDVILNILTLVGFIAYAAGIYLWVTKSCGYWLNPLIRILLSMGPTGGSILIVLIGGVVLAVTLCVDRLRGLNIFLCWFFILSLYQCAANTFLTVFRWADEPINQFFKAHFAAKWYPVKECVFAVIALLLALWWTRSIGERRKLDRVDIALIFGVAATMIAIIFKS